MPGYGLGEVELPAFDLPGDEAELRAQALQELQTVGGKQYRTPEFEEAGDRTNSVRVTVDRSGAVEHVHIRSDWYREITAHGLGPALLEAYEQARRAMINAVALGSLAEEERQAANGRRTTGEDDSADDRTIPYVPESDIWQIWRRLSEIEDLMYRTDKLARAAEGDGGRTVYGPHGLLTATCRGSAITGITAQLSRVGQVSAEELGREALELFQKATARDEREHR